MRDPIEDFIKKNRKRFDDEEPPASIWEKLNENLDGGKNGKSKTDRKIIRLRQQFLWAAAAAVALLFVSVGLWFQLNSQQPNEQLAQANSPEEVVENAPVDPAEVLNMIPEMRAVKAEFSEDLGQYLKALKAFPEAEEDVLEELRELDEHFKNLTEELGNDYSSEEVVEAMIENYRLKLYILERTLGQLKRNSKEVYHEVEV